MSFIWAYLATRAFVLTTVFLFPGKTSSFNSEVIHESLVWVSTKRTTFLEIEEHAKNFSSEWQGYEALEARLAKASTILFSALWTWATSNFVI